MNQPSFYLKKFGFTWLYPQKTRYFGDYVTEKEYSEIRITVKRENEKAKKSGKTLSKVKAKEQEAAELCAMISGNKKIQKNESNMSEVKRGQKELARLRQIERKYNGIREIFKKSPVDVARISDFLV